MNPILPNPMTEAVLAAQATQSAMADHEPAVEIPPMTSDEIQQLRELLARSTENRTDEFRLPDKAPTDEDKTQYYECVLRRTPYSEVHTMMGGKLKVVFREKLKREQDILFNVIQDDFANRRIRSQHDFVTLMNNYNLVVQMVTFQDVQQLPVLPVAGMAVPEDFALKLRTVVENHFVSTVPEMTMMILVGALNQFSNRVRLMAQELLTENFPAPVGAS